MAAGPGGRPVGRVSVRVVPDTSTFAAALEAYLQRLERRLKLEIPVGLDDRTVAITEAKLAALTRDRRIKIDVDSSAIGKAFGGAGGGRRGMGFFNLLTHPAVIVGAVAAIGGAMAALPGIIASIAAPLAAIAVGFDGIKRAAAGLALPFKVMQTTVSNVFEKAFLPGMRELETIFPTLTVGLNQMGEALGKMFSAIVGALTSPQGLQMLGQIFTSIGNAMTTLAPSMGTIVDTFLRLAVAGTAAFERFAPTIAQIITYFNDFVKFADKIGFLKLAMDGLGITIIAILSFLQGLVTVGILVAGAIGAVGAAVRIAAQAVGTAVSAIVGFITSLPGRIGGALSALGGAISGAFQRAFAAARSAVSSGVAAVVGFIRTLPGKARAALASLPGMLASIARNAFNAFLRAAQAVGRTILSWVKSLASSIASAFSSALSIRSPSRVMMKIGEQTMEGYRLGLEDSAAGVTDTLLAVANGIAGIRPTISPTIVDEPAAAGSRSEAESIGRAVAKHLQGATFRMDGRGNLQLIAAGG